MRRSPFAEGRFERLPDADSIDVLAMRFRRRGASKDRCGYSKVLSPSNDRPFRRSEDQRLQERKPRRGLRSRRSAGMLADGVTWLCLSHDEKG